nr:8125_t:CDS:2 [Entrophospora candida]
MHSAENMVNAVKILLVTDNASAMVAFGRGIKKIRWNSTYLMLNKMKQFKTQASMLAVQHPDILNHLNPDENDSLK